MTSLQTDSHASTGHLLRRLALIETRVRLAVAVRRSVDPNPDDPFRGLYLGDEEIDRLLAGTSPAVGQAGPELADRLAEIEQQAAEDEAAGAHLRLRHLARRFELDPLDVDLLLVALAPDIDSRFERFYGYLHDDVTRRRASTGLALELCGAAHASGVARHRLATRGRLVAADLVTVSELDRPFLTRSLRVPDRVTAHLLGVDEPDLEVASLVGETTASTGDPGPLARALAAGTELCYLRERPGSSGSGQAVAALRALGQGALIVDLARIGSTDELASTARLVEREARLQGAAVVAGPVEALADRGPDAVRTFAELKGPVILTGRRTWDPNWSRLVPVVADVWPATSGEREVLWRTSVNGAAGATFDPVNATSHFRLTPGQIARAATAAGRLAVLDGHEMTADHLRAGARSQNGAGLEGQARRIEPIVTWDDLVLPPPTLAALKEVASRARHRDKVIDEWRMRPGGGRGRGVTALFAGDSGTGKTMSAEIIAGELGLDMYAINLATVVDKYVGETEKNLERIFTEADGVNAVLLFDEADAIFGKRSEVRDAHDRYANIEVAYLLQRMESFDGLAILSTNLRANLDDAFSRRLDAVIDFPMPEPEYRRLLWERCLGSMLPREPDVDLDFCAERFELSGGNIHSIALTAAYLAAESGRPVSMLDLMQATQREYRKLGRLCVRSEFGPWCELVVG